MPQRTILEMSREECFECLRQAQVGRFVFEDDDGPAAVPVNYGVAGDRIVFRLERQSHLRAALAGAVAFEADESDPATQQGWSVLIRGAAHEIEAEDLPALLRQLRKAFPHPWAEGVHNVWVAIVPRKVTGRRLAGPYFAALF